jgi:hypothetical protein
VTWVPRLRWNVRSSKVFSKRSSESVMFCPGSNLMRPQRSEENVKSRLLRFTGGRVPSLCLCLTQVNPSSRLDLRVVEPMIPGSGHAVTESLSLSLSLSIYLSICPRAEHYAHIYCIVVNLRARETASSGELPASKLLTSRLLCSEAPRPPPTVPYHKWE